MHFYLYILYHVQVTRESLHKFTRNASDLRHHRGSRLLTLRQKREADQGFYIIFCVELQYTMCRTLRRNINAEAEVDHRYQARLR